LTFNWLATAVKNAKTFSSIDEPTLNLPLILSPPNESPEEPVASTTAPIIPEPIASTTPPLTEEIVVPVEPPEEIIPVEEPPPIPEPVPPTPLPDYPPSLPPLEP